LSAAGDSPAEDCLTPRGKEAAVLAAHRFGFGPRLRRDGYSLDAIAADPRGALLADLERPRAGQLSVDLPSSAQAARAVSDFRAEEQAQRKLALRAAKEVNGGNTAPNMSDAARPPMTAMATGPESPENKKPRLPQQILQNEASTRFNAAVEADIGFVERLTWFWSNHFCISAEKDIAMAGAYEREAIRPYVLGRFGDMLGAVESHPAMLFYLDNVHSMGAASIAGINRDKGLNENLAREILELHTLGVRSGYSQADVTNFANVLTGWSWIDPAEPEHGGEFVFNKRLHEPGAQVVLGKTYPDNGVAQGRAVLADLARHEATAQHIALKFARHFVADDPPPSLVAKLANTFVSSGGNLKALAKTLLTADESWMPQRTKLRPPSEWIAAMLRVTKAASAEPSSVLDLPTPAGEWLNIGRVMNFHATLGQPLWRPPAPNGWPDIEAAWIDGVPRRLAIANEIAVRARPEVDPMDLLDQSLGPLASADTRQTISRAESRSQAFALLLMAPEFLRR
jgi:uncharacterized protein (DUF1800 family)